MAAYYTGGAAASAYATSAGVTASAATAAGFASTSAMAAATTSGIMGMSVATVSGIVGGAAAGFTGGFLASGGDVKAGFQGGLTGGVLGGVGASLSNSSFNPYTQVALKATATATYARLQGGDFSNAFTSELLMAGASEGFQRFVGWNASAMPGENQSGTDPTCRDAGANCYKFDKQGKIPSDWQGKNVIGFDVPFDKNGDFWKQSGTLSKVLNVIPGMNAVGQFHDTIFAPGGFVQSSFNNVATMLPAAAISYAAIMDRLPIDRSRCPSCSR